MDNQKDPELWRIARKRAAFKQNVFSYIIIVIVLWVIWWFVNGRHGRNTDWPWPIWVMIVWGVGLFFDYLQAYNRGDTKTMAEEEYEKLIKERNEEN